ALAGVEPPRLDDATRYYTAAAALRPESPGVHFNLGMTWFRLGRHDEAAAAFEAAVERKPDYAEALAGLGAVVEEVTLPDFALFNACGRVIMAAEGFAIHERDLRERPRDYGRYTYQRLLPGATLSAADLIQAQRLRRELTTLLNTEVLARHDALITAGSLAPAARFDDFGDDWPPPKAATATQTIAFNVTGNPALAMPTGFAASGLPLGMQIVGRPFDEPTVLRVAAAYEAATRLVDRRPYANSPQSGG
nr:amidase family protein [Actinomycetota bacterium]